MYDYGARHYDAALGRWFTIDPLAEKYYYVSPYVYVVNNPLKYVDPDGRKIKTWQYKKYGTEGVSGLSKSINRALAMYMQSEEGYNTIARYASKGDEIAGHTFIVDGEMSGHTLHIQDVSFSDENGQILPSDFKGLINMNSKKDGASTVSLFSYEMTSDEAVETIAHELNLHGNSHKDNIAGKKTPSTEQDHKAIRNKEAMHKGYQSYDKVRNQVIKKYPHLKQVFEGADEEYLRKYKENGTDNR